MDKLIDMFEEHFGRKAGTLMLLVIVLGAMTWAAKIIYENLLAPTVGFAFQVARYWSGGDVSFSQEQIIYTALQIGAGAVGLIIFFVGTRLIVTGARKRTDGLLNESRLLVGKNHALLETASREASAILKTAEIRATTIVRDAESNVAACREFVERHQKMVSEKMDALHLEADRLQKLLSMSEPRDSDSSRESPKAH